MYHWRIERNDDDNCVAISDMGLRVPLGISYKTFKDHTLDAQEQQRIEQEAFEKEALESFGRVTVSGNPPEKENGEAPADINPQTGMYKDYWVLPKEDREKGFLRPLRNSYIHTTCKTSTKMNSAIAETYARNPFYYGGTYCAHCGKHFPVGENGEFLWEDGSRVGT